MLGIANPHDRYRSLRRDPLDCAHDVLVEHQVADDPQVQPLVAVENVQQGVDFGETGVACHGVADRKSVSRDSQMM